MLSPYKKAFRATAGLDAAGQNVINVASPRVGELQDAVNLEYFIAQNTVQEYDPTREHYPVGFVVEYNQRIYKCRIEITSAEAFTPIKWEPMRTDPEWIVTDTSSAASVGNFIYITASTSIDITLPPTPNEGDTVTIADGKGILSDFPVTVITSGGYNIRRDGIYGQSETLTEVDMNVPNSTYFFIFNGIDWTYQRRIDSEHVHIDQNHVSQQGANYEESGFQLSVLETALFKASIQPIAFTLPRSPQVGDTVTLHDLDYIKTQTTAYLNLHPDAIADGVLIDDPLNGESTRLRLDNIGSATVMYIYDSALSTHVWVPIITNDPKLWNDIGETASATLTPRQKYHIEIADAIPSMSLTLPENPYDGDWITISHPKTAHKEVVISVHPDFGVGDPEYGQPDKFKIYNTFETYRNQKYSYYDTFTPSYNTTDTISDIDIGYTFTLVYFASEKLWKYLDISNRIDVADSLFPKRPGVVTLATPAETLAHGIGNAHPEDTTKLWADQDPLVDDVVTVAGLDGRRAAEDQVGMARIGALISDEVLEESRTLSGGQTNVRFDDSAFRHDLIVTPRGFNARTGTETRRGVFEVATQVEARSETNDTHVLTPKKFHAAQAEEGLSGVGKLVISTGTIDPVTETVQSTADMRNARPNNGTAGTIFDHDNHLRFVTPKALNQYRATEVQPGMLWVANPTEVRINNSQVDNAIITPKKLAAWYASNNIRGIIRFATQDEANAQLSTAVADKPDDRPDENWTSVAITPETLHNRTANTSRRGLVEMATQVELDAGVLDDNWAFTPLRFKTWQSYDHFTSDGVAQGAGYGVSGISHSGNIWDGINLSIAAATETQRGTLEVATQSEANAYQIWSGAAFTGAVPSDSHIITPAKLDKRRSTDVRVGLARRATLSEVSSGSTQNGNNDNDPSFVTPGHLTSWQRTATEARALESRYGVMENATVTETWVGNTTVGSTQSYTAYLRNGYAVSPYGLNYALQNYLPKNATADNAQLLDGLDSTQFLRSDIDDYTTGRLTVGGAQYDTNSVLNVRGTGRDVITIQAEDNDLERGLTFRNEGGAYTSSMYTEATSLGSLHANLVFANSPSKTDVDSLIPRMRILRDGDVEIYNQLIVSDSIAENESTANGNSPGTGKLRQKYLGINNNAVTASKWLTPRTVTFAGDLTGSFSMDGSSNVSGVNIQVVNNSHEHSGENITTGTISNDRLLKSSRNDRGVVRVTNDVRTADPSDPNAEHLALSAGAGKVLSERIDLFTPDGGTGDNVAYRDYIQVGETRMSTSDAGVLEFTFGHPIS